MKPFSFPKAVAIVHAGIAVLLLSSTNLTAQTDETGDNGQVFTLAEFRVDASDSSGYTATNAVSGSRLKVSLKDIPLSVDVITESFIEDTGATTLEEILQYSGGVETDFSATGDIGVHVFGRNYGTTPISIRGLLTEDQMRDGFRKIGNTDSVNVSRAEVVRGPNAILYGIGTFGGLANIISKRPLQENVQRVSLAVGSHDYQRATLDVTGPILKEKKYSEFLGYRLTAAWQSSESEVDFYEREHMMLNPVVEFRPFENTSIVLDVEYYKAENTSPYRPELEVVEFGKIPEAFIDTSRGTSPDGRKAFLKLPSESFAYGGSDTNSIQEDLGILASIEQPFGDHIFISGGYYAYTRTRDTELAIRNAGLRDAASQSGLPIRYPELIDPLHPDYLPGLEVNGSPSQAIGYSWGGGANEQFREQVRAEIIGNMDFFGGRNYLTFGYLYNHTELKSKNYKLAYIDPDKANKWDWVTVPFYHAVNNYEVPMSYSMDFDSSTMEFVQQEYGPPADYWDSGYYLVYQGFYWKEQIMLIGGYRWDRNMTKRSNGEYRDGGPSKVNTYQAGITYSPKFEIWGQADPVSIYLLTAQASYPLYNTTWADGSSDPTLGTSHELGVKLDLLDNRLSGQMAFFSIERDRVWYTDTQSLTGDSKDNKLAVADEVSGFDTRIFLTDFLPGLQTVLSYSYLDYGITDALIGDPGTLDFGKVNNPDITTHSFTVWNNWAPRDGILEGFQFGLGITAKSSREVWEQQRNDLLDRGYVYYTEPVNVNGLIKYNGIWKDMDYSIALNMSNLLDNNDLLLYDYKTGRTFRVTLNVKF